MPGRQELKSMGEERFHWGGSLEAPSGKLGNAPSSSLLTTPCPTLAVPDSSSLTIHAVCHTHTCLCRHHPHVKYSAPEKRSAPTDEQRTLGRRFASWQ